MFFLLSKLIGFFLVPQNLLGLLILSSLLMLWKRTFSVGRVLSITGGIALLVLWIFPFGTLLLVPLEMRFPACAAALPATGLVILGGVVDPALSQAHAQIALNGSAERLTYAVGIAQKNPAVKIIVSGGNANLINNRLREADYMARFLNDLGIAKERIIVERESRNTVENALYARRLAEPRAGDRWVLITSAAHMPRAVGVFRKIGFDVVPCPVDYRTVGKVKVFQLPGGFFDQFELLGIAAHEWAGLISYRLTGKTGTLLPGP